MNYELEEAKKTILQLEDAFERFAQDGLVHAVVISMSETTITVAKTNNDLTEVAKPAMIQLKRGDGVLLTKNNQIYKKMGNVVPLGEVTVIERIIGTDLLEVTLNGSTTRILRSPHIKEVEEGDRVIIDSSRRCAVVKIESLNVRTIDKVEKVSWDDIGGQDEAKKELIEAIELPHLYPDIFAHYSKKPTKGILLYGDPGCGKTMMGKAVANSLASGGRVPGFIYVKGPEVLNQYVGNSEANVRNMFLQARNHKKRHGTTAVIFLDEAEALLSVRGGRGSFMEKTIVPTFLAEMDGVGTSDVIVILATNRPETLDPAVVRDGRVDRKVRISRPSQTEAELIFSIYLKKIPLTEITPEEAAIECAKALFCPSHSLYAVNFADEKVMLTLAHLVSGAMIAGIVDKAISLAIHRDIKHQSKSGVFLTDLFDAMHQTVTQNRHTNHDEVIKNVANGREVMHIERV